MFGNVRLAFGTILENLQKSLESGRKSSDNHQKLRHQYVYIIKRTLYTLAQRYEFYVLMARTISHSFAAHTRAILLLPLEHKAQIFSPPCNILYILNLINMVLAAYNNPSRYEYDKLKNNYGHI